MSKENEDGVESFFRKAASQSDTRFRAEDWQQMEKMLDARFADEFAIKRQRIKRTIISGAALSALLLAIYFVSFQPEQTLVGGDNLAEQKQAAVVPKQDVHPENPTAALLLEPEKISDRKNDKTPASGKEQQKKHGTQDVTDPVSQTQQKRFANRRRNIDKTSESIIDDSESMVDDESSFTDLSIAQSTGSDVDDESGLADANVSKAIAAAENYVDSTTAPVSADASMSEETAAEDSEADSMAAPVPEDALSDDHQQLQTDEKETLTTSRWSVNVLVAPDFSTTALGRYSAPGTSIGILIGFQLGKRFIVHGGASYNFKRYEGYGEEYQPPYGYWERRTNGIIPDEILGQCRVLEIPLILQYKIRQSNRSRIFIGAGLGNYIMLDEKYDYAFHTPNPGAADGWSSESSTSYPWAVGSFSVGYDRQLSPALSIGLEPFIKVPFGKIGWSNITLYTTGVNINMRYRFVRRTPSIVSINP